MIRPNALAVLLADCAAAEITIALADAEHLAVEPADRLTPDLRARLASFKADVIELLEIHGDELLGLFDERKES